MRIKSTAVMIVCGAAVVIAGVRLVAWSGKSETERDASRLMVCEACGVVSLLDPETIRNSHAEGNVRLTEDGGARFRCLSCEEYAVRAENLDFADGAVRCQQCGKTLIDTESGAFKAVRGGDVKLDDQGQLAFRCDRCEEFSGRMTPHSDSAGEQSAALEE